MESYLGQQRDENEYKIYLEEFDKLTM